MNTPKCYNCGPGAPKDDDAQVFCQRCSELYEFRDGRMMVRTGMKIDITAREARAQRPAPRQRPGDQPLPIPGHGPSMHDLVTKDLEARKQLGLDRYNSYLQPFNGRSLLRDGYEELQDLLVYLRGKIYEEEMWRMKPVPGTNDQWEFADEYGQKWRLTETRDRGIPFRIELVWRP